MQMLCKTSSEIKKEYNKLYYEKNKDKICSQKRLFRKENKELMRSYDKNRRLEKNKNKPPRIKKSRADYAKKYRENNRDKYRLASLKSDLKKKGLSIEEYEKMLIEQNNSCKICLKHESRFSKRLHVDHCHTTGKVRGLLCVHCNHILGKAFDNIEVLKSAIKYLVESK